MPDAFDEDSDAIEERLSESSEEESDDFNDLAGDGADYLTLANENQAVNDDSGQFNIASRNDKKRPKSHSKPSKSEKVARTNAACT